MGSQFIHRLNALFVLPRNFTMKIKREQRKYKYKTSWCNQSFIYNEIAENFQFYQLKTSR